MEEEERRSNITTEQMLGTRVRESKLERGRERLDIGGAAVGLLVTVE